MRHEGLIKKKKSRHEFDIYIKCPFLSRSAMYIMRLENLSEIACFVKHIYICLVMAHFLDCSKLHVCEYIIQVSVSEGERLLHMRNACTKPAL